MNALRAAYANYPVIVELASEHSTFSFNGGWVAVPDQDHIAYVNADPGPLTQSGLPCGATPPASSAKSYVYYLSTMANAQIALGSLVNGTWQYLTPPWPPVPQTQQSFLNLMTAAGVGIGNTAAHEIGHQFSLPYMDCGIYGHPACPGSDPPYLHYEYGSCSGFPPSQSSMPSQVQYLDVGAPLHWGDPAAANLQRQLLGK